MGASGFSHITGLPAAMQASDVLGVRGADGGDEDGVDLVARDQVLAAVEDAGAAEGGRDLFGPGAVDVRDGGDRGRR